MALTNCYCSVNELLVHIESTDDMSDKMVARCEQSINQASRYIDLVTGRVFYSVTLTSEKVDTFGMSANGLYIDSDRRNVLYSPAPFLSITSITEDTVALVNDTDFYQYNPSSGKIGEGKLIKDGGGLWSSDNKAIVITGSIGYATTPWEIKNICLEVASLIMRAKESFLANTAGDLVGQMEQVLPKTTMTMLRLLRRKLV